ncbi:MAG TPA: hypothetical protein ENN07_03905 [candidate division Zixibacteria bacterium]|nr:hypothetical protein [candidate division Zixibacteria bacterium]
MALKERGEVIEILGGEARVRVIRTEACEDCSAKHGCLLAGKHEWELTVDNTLDARPGEIVDLELAGGAYLGSGFLIFILPLITLTIFYLIGNQLVSSAFGVFFAFIGLFAGMMVALLLSKGKGAGKFKYRMIGKDTGPESSSNL